MFLEEGLDMGVLNSVDCSCEESGDASEVSCSSSNCSVVV